MTIPVMNNTDSNILCRFVFNDKSLQEIIRELIPKNTPIEHSISFYKQHFGDMYYFSVVSRIW